MEEFDKIIRLYPSSITWIELSFMRKGMIYQEKGRFKEALMAYRKVIDRSKDTMLVKDAKEHMKEIEALVKKSQ